MEVEIQARRNPGELDGGPEQLCYCSQTPSSSFLYDRYQQFFISRNQVEKKTQRCFLMVFLKLNHTCLSASTALSAKYLQFPAGDDDTSLNHRLVLLSLMKPISSSPWTHLPDFTAPNISEKHVHLQSQSQLSGQQRSVTSVPCEPVGQQIRNDPRSNDCFYKNPTLRSLSGSSTVVWRLVQYKWWRTNMASSYISTPVTVS